MTDETGGLPGTGAGGVEERDLSATHGALRSPPGMRSEPPPEYHVAAAPFLAELAELRPDGELWDVHTHLGVDEDGRSQTLEQLLGVLDAAGVARACTFPLHDPDRHPAYRVPNDRVLEWTAQSDGRLVPFCRLDPAETAVEEGERAIAAGARGIKLHPRAQIFSFDSPEMEAIFALAERAQVPILIHMGRGMPPVADALLRVAHKHPGAALVLAHAAIADQATITHGLRDHPAAYFDTSNWAAWDVVELFARVPAERILFGSDPPYGHSITGLYLALRSALAAGGDEAVLRKVAGENTAALLAGRPGAPNPPVGSRRVAASGALMRVYGYIGQAFGGMFTPGGLPVAAEMCDLALAACRDPDPGDAGESLERIGAALTVVRDLMRNPAVAWHGMGLLHMTSTLAATS